jgi:hypothetical protein
LTAFGILAVRAGFKRALLILACAVTLEGCATGDFPRAESAAGGVKVTWKGSLIDMKLGAPQGVRAVHLEGRERWTLVFGVMESDVPVLPFVKRRSARIGVEDALSFFGSNDASRGLVIRRTFIVWRSADGNLHAVDVTGEAGAKGG